MKYKNAPKVADKIQEYQTLLTTGTVLSIDPSCGSESSLPGFAYFISGELNWSGTWPMDIRASLPVRLQQLGAFVREICVTMVPDVVVVEDIPRFMRGRGKASTSLHKAVGAIISNLTHSRVVEILPATWTSLTDDAYVKSDEADAIYIGKAAIYLATILGETGKWRGEKELTKKKTTRKRKVRSYRKSAKKTYNSSVLQLAGLKKRSKRPGRSSKV